MVIVIGGMIGLGKTTTALSLKEELNLPVYLESVEGNKVLPLFYTSDEKELARKRYPFLLQMNFLLSRYQAIKKALLSGDAILDRSIYEDYYFASRNHDLGRISDLEFEIYNDFLQEMMEDVHRLDKKTPDLMVYLKGSFPSVLRRIQSRGRGYEVDSSLEEYYHFLWKDYDDFILNHYKESPILVVDIDEKDINFNPEDKKWLISKINEYRK